jgi:hypothetical protein
MTPDKLDDASTTPVKSSEESPGERSSTKCQKSLREREGIQRAVEFYLQETGRGRQNSCPPREGEGKWLDPLIRLVQSQDQYFGVPEEMYLSCKR